MSILVLNAGSSTLKFAVFDEAAREVLLGGAVDWRGGSETATTTFRPSVGDARETTENISGFDDAVAWITRSIVDEGFAPSLRVVGHRVVHGGTEFRDSIMIDDRISRSLQQTARLAPLHNPPALTSIRAAQSAFPDVPQVAVFDTAYFADLPPRGFIYPVPFQWYERYGIRRYGFHGISHAYCASRAAALLGREEDASLRLVVCHLGNGCSATAIRGGQPLATTMGFTPLEGLMMGTRSGSIDPGILIHLLQQQGMSAADLEDCLNRRSGLLGVSGISSDMQKVEQAADAGNQRAILAMDLFADRIRSAIGSLAVAMGGVDGLVFTAGIGEHSSRIRSHSCQGLACLGLKLDAQKNQTANTDADIALGHSDGRILIVKTRENLMIAREAMRFVEDDGEARRECP